MVRTNRLQRVALKRVFDRSPLFIDPYGNVTSRESTGNVMHYGPITYREFRKKLSPAYDCVMIHWCGMWLGIEPDGYTHS